jgi:hypothetical protein
VFNNGIPKDQLEKKFGGTIEKLTKWWPPAIPPSAVINTNPDCRRIPTIYDMNIKAWNLANGVQVS